MPPYNKIPFSTVLVFVSSHIVGNGISGGMMIVKPLTNLSLYSLHCSSEYIHFRIMNQAFDILHCLVWT